MSSKLSPSSSSMLFASLDSHFSSSLFSFIGTLFNISTFIFEAIFFDLRNKILLYWIFDLQFCNIGYSKFTDFFSHLHFYCNLISLHFRFYEMSFGFFSINIVSKCVCFSFIQYSLITIFIVFYIVFHFRLHCWLSSHWHCGYCRISVENL